MTFKLADKLGFSPPFQFTEEQEEGFYEGGIDYAELGKKLAKTSRFPFDYKKFANDPTIFTSNPLNEGELHIIENDTPIIVSVDEVSLTDGKIYKVEKQLKLKGKLNKRIALVAKRQGKVRFSFRLKPNKYAQYIKKIKYEFLNINAIELTAFSYKDYTALSKYINTKENPSVRDLIIEKFKEAFTKVDKDLSTLKWLYENAPQFVLKKRGDDKLLADLQKLVKYDKDSWFKDSSSAILNLLIGFNNIKTVYDYFHDNPQKAIDIYSVLDSNSQQQFCIMLDVLSLSLTTNEDRISSAKFIIGKDYTLNSNIFLNDNQEEILLEQSKLTKQAVPARKRLSTTVAVPISQQTKFHPLDLVTLVDQATGEEKPVTALHVKLLSDQAEWAQVVSTTILVVSIIVIILSAGTLAAGATGIVAVIAVTEIVVASLDILQEVLKNADTEHSEAGKWFIEHWDKISGTVGLINLTGALRKGILKNGPKLLASIRKLPNTSRVLQIRESVNAFITSLRVEFYFAYKQGLVYCKILPLPDVINFIGSKFANKMAKFGISLSEPVEGATDIKALIYNGEKIAEGTKKDLKKVLEDIFPYGPLKNEKVLAKLDELEAITKKVRLRQAALIKWKGKFSKLYNHIDGELILQRVSRRNATQILNGAGGHNFHAKGLGFKVRRYLTDPIIDDLPFDVLISVKYKNGRFLDKIAKSSMFPKNWSITRINEEIALIYDEAVTLGKQYQHKALDSTGSFWIKIEFDSLGNLRNAHPILN